MGEFQRIAAGSVAVAAILVIALPCTAAASDAAEAAEAAAADETVDMLRDYSLEELASLEVTSVSKRPEPLGHAPAAVFAITAEDIRRSGATSLPEVLRLAPNLLVSQTSSSGYTITARGFNGSPAAQNFSNKLLVLIDGRSVYSPLFSGVYWDMQDVVLQDIERIEVISGPGSTLWGANAFGGVINITTRHSADTQGGLLAAFAGDQERGLSLRYGGSLGDTLTWRLYGRSVFRESMRTADGTPAHDHWSKPQVGFRLDWAASDQDLLTLQGDAYDGSESQRGAPHTDIRGGNLTARWTRDWASGAQLQAQAYYDRAVRSAEVDGSGFKVETYDLDVQHSFMAGARHEIVVGGGIRSSRYRIAGQGALQFSPAAGTLNLQNLFIQDSITLGAGLQLVLGAKVEDDPYLDPVLLPNARLSWSPDDTTTVWAAVSKAIRSPTPFDRDVLELQQGRPFLVGGADFRSEKVTAYQLGVHTQPSHRTRLSVSGFYNVFDDLRSIEFDRQTFIPLYWGNLMYGHSYGVEAWGDFQATPWWRLSAAASYLDEKFHYRPGSSAILGPSQAGDDPKYQASLKSSMDLGGAFTLDAALRYVSPLPEPRVSDYVELNGRLGWNVTEKVQLSLAGRNLLHARHEEYPQGALVPRSVVVGLQWRF